MMERSKCMNVPEIRFKGEQLFLKKQLKEIATINPKNTLPDFFEYVDLESVVGTEMKKHRTEIKESAPSRAQRLANKGDIFFQTVRPYQQNNLYFDLDAKNFVFSTGYAQIRSKINSKYLFTILQQSNFLNQVLENCTGSSYPAINPSSLANLFLTICDNEVVQQKIASYFQSLDSLIQTISKKLASLKQIKAASLQSMFPQEGETVPKVRFKGFEGEWERCSLGSLSMITKGEQINKLDLYTINKYYVLNGGITPSGYTNKYNTEANTISISEGGNSCGYVNFNNEKFWSGGHNYTLQKVKINNYYLYSFLKNNEASIMSKRVGSGLPNIQKKSLTDFLITYPSLKEEQQKIASYFYNLDKQISLQTQCLEKLKQIKAACLDKMFV